MGKETPLVTHAEAERVRKRIGQIGELALGVLAEELKHFGRKKDDLGRWVTVPLPEEWARNYKTVADQLRRDYRLDASEQEDEAPAVAPADPLAGLKVVGSKEAG